MSGHVLGPGGRPVESFRVELHRADFDQVPSFMGFPVRSVAGCPDGSFVIEGLREGSFVVVALAPELAPGLSELFVLSPGGSTSGVDVHLARGGEIRGSVLDSRTGEPIIGARIGLEGSCNGLSEPGFTEVRVQAGPDGRFRIEHVGTGAHVLWIAAQGRAAAYVEEVCVTDGKMLELPPQPLGPGATITGVVLGHEGTPLSGASVHLGPADQRFYGHRSTRADAEGAFRIDDVTLGAHELSATCPISDSNDPFEAISDMKCSQCTVRVEAETSYTFDLDLRKR